MSVALHKKNRSNAWFQLILDIITTIIFITMMQHALFTLSPYDAIPSVIPASKVPQSKGATKVETGIYIQDFVDFDIVKGTFLVDLSLWFRFDPKQISLEAIDQFTFDRAEIKSKSSPAIKIEGSKLFVSHTMRILFELPLNYRTFPLDDHRLSFSLSYETLTPDKIILIPGEKSIVVHPEVDIKGWKIVHTTTTTGYYQTDFAIKESQHQETHPRAIFTFTFGRTSSRHLVSIFLPLLLIFFIALFSFTFSVRDQEAEQMNLIDISAASILGIVAYRFVIEELSPAVGYFMLSDYMFMFFLIITTVIFAMNSYADVLTGKQKDFIALLFHCIVNIFFFYLLQIWLV
jgi:hypothetical protein